MRVRTARRGARRGRASRAGEGVGVGGFRAFNGFLAGFLVFLG